MLKPNPPPPLQRASILRLQAFCVHNICFMILLKLQVVCYNFNYYYNFIQLILKKNVYFLSLFGLWLRVSTKFFSTKASSSSNALFACFSASYVAFEGLHLLLNCVANPNYRYFFFLYGYFYFKKSIRRRRSFN